MPVPQIHLLLRVQAIEPVVPLSGIPQPVLVLAVKDTPDGQQHDSNLTAEIDGVAGRESNLALVRRIRPPVELVSFAFRLEINTGISLTWPRCLQ
jgi:hypothetical protein